MLVICGWTIYFLYHPSCILEFSARHRMCLWSHHKIIGLFLVETSKKKLYSTFRLIMTERHLENVNQPNPLFDMKINALESLQKQ